MLTAAQWNFPVDETTLVPVDLPIERREVLLDKARRLRELLTKCTALRVDHSEYACLKAIVLFKAGEQVRSKLSIVSFSFFFLRFVHLQFQSTLTITYSLIFVFISINNVLRSLVQLLLFVFNIHSARLIKS